MLGMKINIFIKYYYKLNFYLTRSLTLVLSVFSLKENTNGNF